MSGFGAVDLHMHSTVSDGTDSPAELLERVKKAGIGLFSLTDHDAIRGCGEIRSLLKPGDPRFVPGVEFGCRDEQGKYHILGYGYDPDAEAIRWARLDFLKQKFGIFFPEQEERKLLELPNPGKPHIGNLMVRLGYAETKEQAIRDFLNHLRLREDYVRPEQAISGILEAGGIPVLAHPCYGAGDQLILDEALEQRVLRLMGFGLKGLEGWYSGFSEKMSAQVLELAERQGLYVTAGSDYHGKNKLVRLGDTGFPTEGPCPEGWERFVQDVVFERGNKDGTL